MARRIKEPTFSVGEVISDFHRQTLLQLRTNFATQHIFPFEVYPHYKEINEARRKMGSWYSTGEGIKSLDGEIIQADESNITLSYTFNDYLQFVDIGVGGKTTSGDVERNRNVRFRSRYVTRWNRGEGRSHRPGIMPELRHLQTRIRDYMVDFWGFKGEMYILNTFDDLEIKVQL